MHVVVNRDVVQINCYLAIRLERNAHCKSLGSNKKKCKWTNPIRLINGVDANATQGTCSNSSGTWIPGYCS
jgi:hypothetical protein